jgi:hypothetical protein
MAARSFNIKLAFLIDCNPINTRFKKMQTPKEKKPPDKAAFFSLIDPHAS